MLLTAEQVLLYLVVGAALAVTVSRFAPASIVAIATIGLLSYSVPAIVGLTHPLMLETEDRLIPTSGSSVIAVAVAWLGYLAVLLWPGATTGEPDRRADEPADPRDRARLFLVVAAVLAVALTAVLMAQHGPFFFLIERAEIGARLGNEYLVWKWLSVLGVIGAFATRRWGLFALFSALLVIILLIGDRTVPVIAIVAVALIALRRHSWPSALRDPIVLGSGALAVGVIFLAKPLYVALKSPEIGLADVLDPAFLFNLSGWLQYWEPFAIHQILEDVIAYRLTIDPLSILVGSAGQLLIVPSAFGIDSSVFNEVITTTLYPDLEFGVAYNYLAQGYAWAGYAGVLVHGLLFGLAARFLDARTSATSGPPRWFWLLAGVVVAVYVHRNSIENELAILRHVAIAFGLTYVLAVVFVRRREPATSLNRPVQSEVPAPNGRPLLSVCIPTYGRRARVTRLVEALLKLGPDVEICVHVDGSVDGTAEDLARLARLGPAHMLVSSDRRRGRAYAMRRALKLATGRYAMFYDDDDDVDPGGISGALTYLNRGSPHGYCGFVFHMRDEGGNRRGSAFPRATTNFLEMRWDDNVRGGKKEVVLTPLLNSVVDTETRPARGRWPTSLLWSTLALDYDVETIDLAVGTTRHLRGGMTSSITKLKLANPWPMYDLYRQVMRGYRKARYRSRTVFVTAILKASLYGAYGVTVHPLVGMVISMRRRTDRARLPI